MEEFWRSSGGVEKRNAPQGVACGAVKTCFCGTIAVFLVCRLPGTSRTCYSGDIDWLWILCVSDEILHIMQSKSRILLPFSNISQTKSPTYLWADGASFGYLLVSKR